MLAGAHNRPLGHNFLCSPFPGSGLPEGLLLLEAEDPLLSQPAEDLKLNSIS